MQSLELASNMFGASGTAALAPAVASMQQLQRLVLSSSELHLVDALPKLTTLTQLSLLDLSGNFLRNAGEGSESDGAACGSALAALRSLRLLTFGHMKLPSAAWACLLSHLTALTALQRLRLDNLALAQAGTAALADALPVLCALESLELASSSLDLAGAAAALGPALRALPLLTRLSLYNCTLSFADVAAVLNSCSYTADSFSHSTPVAATERCHEPDGTPHRSCQTTQSAPFHSLIQLDIGRCTRRPSDAGGEAAHVPFAAGLQLITTLTRLSLDSCGLGDAAAAELAPALARLTRLRSVRLGDNRLTRDAVLFVLRALEELRALEAVHLDGNYLSPVDEESMPPWVRNVAVW